MANRLREIGIDEITVHSQDYWREQEEPPSIDYDAPEFVYDGVPAEMSQMEAAE